MNSEQLKEIIDKNTEYFDEGEYGTETNVYYDNIILEVGQIIQDEAFDKINDILWGALQSDLEHGVKSLNEEAASKFYKTYPALKEFMEWMNCSHKYVH